MSQGSFPGRQNFPFVIVVPELIVTAVETPKDQATQLGKGFHSG